MTKSQKVQRIAGVVLLATLLLPVIVMSIPATRTEIAFRVDPGSGLVEPVFVDTTYIPLVELLRTVDGTYDDVLVLAGYAGLFTLSVWLVKHNVRRRLKEA